MRILRRLLAPLLVAALCAPALRSTPTADRASPRTSLRDDTLAHIEQLPASNPYRAALLRYQTLPPADREYLTAWSLYETPEGEAPRTLDARQQQIARELSSALLTAATQPDTTESDWPPLASPAAPDDPVGITIPGVSAVRGIAWIATKNAASLPPSEAAPVYVAIAQLGRRQRSGVKLGEQMAGAGIEVAAQTEIARRLTEFSDADLARLSDSLARLQSPPTSSEILEREIDLVLRPTIDLHLLPALRGLVAQAALAEEPPRSSADPDAGFTSDLRLSGLLRIAENDHQIVLEDTRLGETFSLLTGQSIRGIELASLDYDKRLAVIRRGKREALVHLESKKIVEQDPASTERPGNIHSRQDRKLLARIRSHPDGVDGFVREVFATNERFLRRRHELAELPHDTPHDSREDGADGIYLVANPSFGATLRTLNRHAVQSTMLQAAIRHRRNELHPDRAQSAPADPWATAPSDPFPLERTADGGFLLRSRYEVRPNQPVAFKFAASDAGYLRVFKP